MVKSNNSKLTNHLIIGMGEVGRALHAILVDHYNVMTADCKGGDLHEDLLYNGYVDMEKIDIMHVCFPYSESFNHYVKKYQRIHKPKYTVIHSTVPVGTSRALGAIHSPIRGLHPNLESGIRTFEKFLGGAEASYVADTFRRAGLKVILVDKPEVTEAGKLFDTEYYRVCVDFTKRVGAYCRQHNLSFHEVYTLFNQTYNEGYEKLGLPEVRRPVLQDIQTPIGGHCLVPNSKLIKY